MPVSQLSPWLLDPMIHSTKMTYLQPFPEGHLGGDPAICCLLVFSLISPHTHDKVNKSKFLKDTEYTRYFALYKDSL